MNKPEIFISAGEISGEMHAARMLCQLKKLEPGASFSGLGGEGMRSAGVRLLADLDRLAVMGLVEVVRHLRSLRLLLKEIENHLRQVKPDLVVLVDFPDFNFRIAAAAKKLNIPVLYYIGPQIWAWRTGRKKQLARLADKLAVIFPFEIEFYRDQPLEVEFVGHPLLETLHTDLSRSEFCNRHDLDESRPLVGIMPGSREQEIHRHFDIFIRAAELVTAEKPGVQFAVGLLPHTAGALSERQKNLCRELNIRLIHDDSRGLIACSTALITKSGTTTMEAALHGTPMVVGYRTNALSYLLAKHLVKVSHIAMPNLLAPPPEVPELVQNELTPQAVAAHLLELVNQSSDLSRRITAQCKRVRQLLTTEKPASLKVAEIALEMCRRKNDK
jgi:lipid-A-disaccharide synthase